jgi:hypothetical protein
MSVLMPMGVRVRVGMVVVMLMGVFVRMGMVVPVMIVPMTMMVVAMRAPVLAMPVTGPVHRTGQAHVDARSVDAVAGFPGHNQLELVPKAELVQLAPEIVGVHAEIDHGREVHVAAESGETVIIQYFHGYPIILCGVSTEGQEISRLFQSGY